MIPRRTFLQTLAAPAIVTAKNRARPNILCLLTDQQHIDSIAAGGCRYSQTPSMDWLQQRGMSFGQSYCPDPVCSPSRSAIFTGRMPSETGVTSNGYPIREGIPNLGQWFRENSDYERIYAGKWHVPQNFAAAIDGFRVLPGGIAGQGNLGDSCVAHSCDAYLRNRSGSKPFLMVASFLQPHDICEWLRINMENRDELPFPELKAELPPLPANFAVPPGEPEHLRRTRGMCEPAQGKWSRQHWRYYLWSYYRHVEMVDGQVGRILEALRATGREQDTLIVLTADHGEGLAHHQMVRKSISYDSAVRVPLLISYPQGIPPSRQDKVHPVSGVDLMPTLCDFAGLKPPPLMRGRSLRPLMQEKPQTGDAFIVSEIPVNVGRVVRTARYKYVTYADDPVEQLYDMQNDPGETRNLARSHGSVLSDHKKLLRRWESRLQTAPENPHAEWWRNL